MSHTSRNFVVAYVLLVGLPLLGLAGVLRTGRTLHAPISVDGIWKVESGSSHLAAQPCDQVLSSFLNTSAVISQSGKNLVITFNNASKTVAFGVLEGKSLKSSILSARDSSRAPGCGDQTLTLTATVDPTTEPKSLSGQLAVNNCQSCTPLEFHAARQARATGEGAH